uniref:Integrator complex subunit 14 n=1 Tax=Strigamia maritima TaxID=126957 RepID=T1JDL9_STRMM
MPTILLLDVSLSMLRPIIIPESIEVYQRRHLAAHGINTLLDYMAANCRLEFTCLMAFSSLWEIVCPFTRDYDHLKSYLSNIEIYDRTCMETALEGVKNTVLEEWGAGVLCQIILITDGSAGSNFRTSRLTRRENKQDKVGFALPFPFSSKLHIMCIGQPDEASLLASIPLYQNLIDLNGSEGQVFVPEGSLNHKSVEAMFTKLADTYFAPFHGQITCGHLSSNIQLFPPPQPFNRPWDFEWIKRSVADKIEICGFLDLNDISSPASYSRHLVLPSITNKSDAVSIKPDAESGDEDIGSSDDGKTASFCVLLHGSLKVESMVAVCSVGEDWYGILYSWADSKKKSNLMLTIFEPGVGVIPWLGKLDHLAPLTDFKDHPYGEDDSVSPFPLKPSEKRSYAQGCVVWIRQSGLQADIQKILRYARKLPEKTQNFYKELNRLRKAALAYGFLELLERMASILERECTLLPGTAHPDAALQLTHASNMLRTSKSHDWSQNIYPMRTKFTSGDV